MIRRGDYIYQYYCPVAHTHGIPAHKRNDRCIRLLRQRLDGFVFAEAGPKGGELTTPLLTFEGSRLNLNIDCGAMGEAWVEVLDAHGHPIPGFSMDDAVSVDRNGVAQEVWWKQGPCLSKLTGQPVRLHIKMRSARLFAFQFTKAR